MNFALSFNEGTFKTVVDRRSIMPDRIPSTRIFWITAVLFKAKRPIRPLEHVNANAFSGQIKGSDNLVFMRHLNVARYVT